VIKLGQKVRDVVTGFEGVADCRMEWMNGCVRISVQPKMRRDKEDGAQFVQDAKVFDEQQLEVLEEKPIKLPKHKLQESPPRRRPGGGRPTPAVRRDPR